MLFDYICVDIFLTHPFREMLTLQHKAMSPDFVLLRSFLGSPLYVYFQTLDSKYAAARLKAVIGDALRWHKLVIASTGNVPVAH